MTPALVFIGFMGAGKSAALEAARAEGLEGTDADALLERELGEPIAGFFAREGEAEFRRREEGVVARLLGEADGGAVALGGGAVLSPRVREELRRHVAVWLDVGPEDAWERVAGSDERPLARDRDAFLALYAERRPLYEEIADAVIPAPEWGSVERALPALRELPELPAGTRLLWAIGSRDYPVYVGPQLLGADFWPLPESSRRFCVTDANVGPLHAAALGELAASIGVAPGEEAKTLAEAERVLRELARAGMRRGDHVVALGGGVVGDLAGFCAAVYQRGVDVVQCPTSLVAQVDSAYGGKTGVDLPEAKNYVGAFHLPAAVVCDTAALATLPREELAAGFAEVVKTALLAGGELWERVRTLGRLDAQSLAPLVFPCACFKCDVVARDERDAGLRAILNLGHTVGHAVEAAGGYRRYRHGEAVALGLLAALRLSGADALREEVSGLLARHGLPVALDPAIGADEVLAALSRDKKRDAAGVRFVLLERPGEPRPGSLVEPDSVRAAVEELYG